jgi:hypothetical protein
MLRQQPPDDFAERVHVGKTADGLHLARCGDEIGLRAVVHDQSVAPAVNNLLKQRNNHLESVVDAEPRGIAHSGNPGSEMPA